MQHAYERSTKRVATGMLDVPQLVGLAGVTMQDEPDKPNINRMQVLKWAKYDASKRTLTTKTTGGCGQMPGEQGTWASGESTAEFISLLLFRCMNFTYK